MIFEEFFFFLHKWKNVKAEKKEKKRAMRKNAKMVPLIFIDKLL